MSHERLLATASSYKPSGIINIMNLQTGCNNGRLTKVAWNHIQWLALILVMLSSVTMAFINLANM